MAEGERADVKVEPGRRECHLLVLLGRRGGVDGTSQKQSRKELLSALQRGSR